MAPAAAPAKAAASALECAGELQLTCKLCWRVLAALCAGTVAGNWTETRQPLSTPVPLLQTNAPILGRNRSTVAGLEGGGPT